MTQTATSTATKPGTAVVEVKLDPPRLPYPMGLEERFGFDRASWKALVEAVWPLAQTSGAVVLALSYCRARKLDPFKRVAHIVPVYDSKANNGKGGYVETIWPGIAEHRTTAFRTTSYAGADACVFGPTVREKFVGKVKHTDWKTKKKEWKTETVDLAFPEWAQMTVYRLVQGQRVAFPGPRVYFREIYSTRGRSVLPNERWQRAPFQMTEKCAEAAALRRAFPEELGDEWTAEEAGAFGGVDAQDVTPTSDRGAPPRPTRAGAASVGLEPEDPPGITDIDPDDAGEGGDPDEEPPMEGEDEPDDRKGPGPENDPPAAGTEQTTSPWAIVAAGQEAVIKRAYELLGSAQSAADVDEMLRVNDDRMSKWPAATRTVFAKAVDTRRAALSGGGK